MRKKTAVLFLVFLAAVCFCACSMLEEIPFEITKEDGKLVIGIQDGWVPPSAGEDGSASEEENPSVGIDAIDNALSSDPGAAQSRPEYTVQFDPNEHFADEAARRAAQIIDPAIAEAVRLLNTLPPEEPFAVLSRTAPDPLARDTLTDPLEREIYDTLLEAAANFGYYCYDQRDYDDFFSPYINALYALKADRPELFLYFDGGGEGFTYTPGYFMPGYWMNDQTDDYAAIQAEVQLFDRVVERILQKMPEGLSNYGKCCYFAFVITVRNEYDHAQETLTLPYQPYNTLVWGTGVCQGYARTFALLCEKAGILCRYCTGLPPLDDGDSHAWNRVDSDAGYIYVDVTWYDRDIPMTTYRDGGLDYLFMTQEEFDFLGYTQEFVEEP